MSDNFPIPIPGQSLGVSFAKATLLQRQAVISLFIMARATQEPLVETKNLTNAGLFPPVAPHSLQAVLAGELDVNHEQARGLLLQGSGAVFGPLKSLPLSGRQLALVLAIFMVAPGSPDLLSPITTKLVMAWGRETQVMPAELMPYLVRYGAQITRFLSGKEFTSN